MPSAKEMSKAQPMSISQLCQQDYSDDDLHNIKQDLTQDPLDLKSEDNPEPPYILGHNGYSHHMHQNGHDLYSQQPSNVEVESDQFSSNHQRREEQPDSAERMAAEALGDMARSTSAAPSGAAGSSFMAPAGPLFSRMSNLPLVNSAVNSARKAYENGKQNSKVMKYGAEMVESGVKSLSKPVFEKLEPTLGQLDDFACRQLDKVYPKSEAHPFPSPTDSTRSSNDYFAHRSRGDSIDSVSSASSSRPSFDTLGSRTPRRDEVTLRHRSDSQSSQRRLKSSNFHVGSASAAGVAIFSEESMKSLKYCLQWLQYAVHHIDHQIGLLRAFLASLASPSKTTEIVPSTAASTLNSIKKEVVDTLRKVITIVSRYAGACLPDPAKISVRQFILSMPSRWATLNSESVPSTPISSPSLGPVDRCREDLAALHETSERANRVLAFANESSDMLRSVATIFKDSVDKAENWMDKLRYVGMNPQSNTDGLPSWAPTGFPIVPTNSMPGGFPGASLEQYSLRQTHSSSNGHNSNGQGTPTGSPTRSLKSSPRLGSSRGHNNHHYSRHAYRQRSVMSGDEDSGTDEEDTRVPLAMDDDSSFDDDEDAFSLNPSSTSNGRGPMKRSMGSFSYPHGNPVRRHKKRGESAEVVAGLGVANGHAVDQESI
ncbi:hypothetical protein BGZ65_002308 [Modicella reniformis]|uniref:Opi1-domain-containing protein n=1 Tax=Modicella reniformis TaxID=1440133 RepID=A0A9P6M0H2_9FUNG|nr:hypothetical protein BGZ65_002308 [Modicella reniformis]